MDHFCAVNRRCRFQFRLTLEYCSLQNIVITTFILDISNIRFKENELKAKTVVALFVFAYFSRYLVMNVSCDHFFFQNCSS